MARTVVRTFKDSILVATAVFVVKPCHALMASQRKDTPATTRTGPTACPVCPARTRAAHTVAPTSREP